MKIIGITGGVGAGKSTVLHMLETLTDCRIIMADDVAKGLMARGEALSADLVRLFGAESYEVSGQLNTAHIANRMYGAPSLKQEWESLVHPAVKKAIRAMIAAYELEAPAYIFIEAALLIEDHYEEICDEFWYIFAEESIRAERLSHDRGYSPEKTAGIFAAQSQDAVFRAHSTFVVDTGISPEYTMEQLMNRLNTQKEI